MRRSSANASRCVSVASRDAPREVRRIPRLAIGRQSRVSERWRASASARRKRGKRTLCAPGLGRLHLAGGPVGSGRAGETGCGQFRVASARDAASRDRCGDVGIVSDEARDAEKTQGAGSTPARRTRRATFRGRTWRSRTPCRPRGRRTWSWRTCLLRGCEGSGEVRALECIKHARARLFIDKKSRAKISISVNGTWSY